jgi:hypothetical protein
MIMADIGKNTRLHGITSHMTDHLTIAVLKITNGVEFIGIVSYTMLVRVTLFGLSGHDGSVEFQPPQQCFSWPHLLFL